MSDAARSDATVETGSLLELDGVFNFRDLGGHPIGSGGTTTSGRVYRADGLHRSPPEQRHRLHDLGVRTVVDLRTEAEIEREGRFEADGIEWSHAPIFQALTDFLDVADADGSVDLLCHHFEHMATSNTEAMAGALGLIAEASEQGPTVFHCTAGKDRTGVLAALILSGLGVPDEVVAADFARSAPGITKMVDWYRRTSGASPVEKMAEMGVDPALAPVVMGAEASTMTTFLSRLREANGGIATYLTVLGAADAVDRLGGVLRPS